MIDCVGIGGEATAADEQLPPVARTTVDVVIVVVSVMMVWMRTAMTATCVVSDDDGSTDNKGVGDSGCEIDSGRCHGFD